MKQKILLDIGHSKKKAGAKGEYKLNCMQAEACRDYLEPLGFKVEIYDPDIDDLASIGKHAAGFDCFVSFHLNSCKDKTVDYSTCIVDSRHTKASSFLLAKRIMASLTTDSSFKAYRGTEGEGLMLLPLVILNNAERASKCPCVMVESFFVSNSENQKHLQTKSILAGHLVGRGIQDYFMQVL